MRQTIISVFFLNIFIFFITVPIYAQNSTLEGYVFEEGNRGFLNTVTLTITQKGTNKFIANTTTDEAGFFTAMLPVNKTYLIQASKALFLSQQTTLMIKSTDKGKKVFTKIKMFRKPDDPIDAQKITPTTNPGEITLVNLVEGNDLYAEVTNATRLVDENYEEAIDKELIKIQPIPTNYQSPVKINLSTPNTGPKINQDLLNPYNQKTVNKIIVPEPELGETIVAVAQNNPKTQTLLQNYTGYKIEFYTTLSALPATHNIFNQHGNIVLERKENGLYSYLLGDFADKRLAETFLQETLLNRYPTATLVCYENGQRIRAKKSTKLKTTSLFAPPR